MDGLQPRPLSLHGLYLEDMRIICRHNGVQVARQLCQSFYSSTHPSIIHPFSRPSFVNPFIYSLIHIYIYPPTSFFLSSFFPFPPLLFIPLSAHPPIHPSVPLCSHTYIHPPIFSFSFLYIHLSFHSCTSPSHVRHCARHRGTRIQRARLYLQVCNVCLCTCLC